MLPPVPSDAAVALGALLSNRGVTTPLAVFLVTWIANLLGAAGVYYASRRYGRRLFATPTGRRLLAPRSLAIIEREYLRLGTLGIFISRFLPGIRAVVPPFAGLIGLSTLRTFVPIGLASAIWYGGITILGAVIGAEWERITALIASVNRTLGLVTAIVAAASAVWWVARVRRRRRERVWHATQDALDPAAPSFMAGTELAEGSAQEAAALVVLELAYADPVLTPEERRLIAEHLHARWGLGKLSPPPAPQPEAERRTRFADYAQRLRKRVGRKERLELVERMWTVAFADGAIGEHESRLMRLAAELLDIGPGELAEVSRRLQARHGT
ncbi:MAG: TerB family tellurite resistance protein [Gemmatimonadota bacterium]|nr:TerB family tellurite resistance protein [Gemmatimonadota bacterium]